MCKKPSKVNEAQVPCPSEEPTKLDPRPESGSVRYIDDATFKKISDKIFKTRHELFRKLAQ